MNKRLKVVVILNLFLSLNSVFAITITINNQTGENNWKYMASTSGAEGTKIDAITTSNTQITLNSNNVTLKVYKTGQEILKNVTSNKIFILKKVGNNYILE